MKKILLGLLALMALTSVAHAQTPSFNFVRTSEVPGYFLVEIIPDITKPAIDVNDTFIVNFPTKENENYTDVLKVVQGVGGKTISAEEFFGKTTLQKNRYFVLGDPIEGLPTFQVRDKSTALEDFDYFLGQFLYPVYLTDIESSFGGNVSDVVPVRIPFGSSEGDVFVGKFQKAMKTRMELRANSSEGTIVANTILDFTNPLFTQNPIAQDIPAIWEDFHAPLEQADPSTKQRFFKWANLFPVVLVVVGVLIILFGILWFRKKTEDDDDVLPEDFWKNAPSHVVEDKDSHFKSNDDDLPFEIKLKKPPYQ